MNVDPLASASLPPGNRDAVRKGLHSTSDAAESTPPSGKNHSTSNIHIAQNEQPLSKVFLYSTLQPTQVVLCGCGNAVHVLTSYLGRHADLIEVNILSLSHADRLIDSACPKNRITIRCINDIGEVIEGTPNEITSDPKVVIPGCKVILFALPADRHERYLKAMLPHIRPGTLIGSMPGEGGFDLCVRHAFGKELADSCTLFTLDTLPWACRIETFGHVVHILGTKKDIDLSVRPGKHCWEVRDLLQKMIGPQPVIHTSPTANFLGDSLMNPNAVAHPSILHGLLRSWDGKTPFDEPPLFYQAVDDYTAATIEAVSKEDIQVKSAILERYPSVDLSEVRPFSVMFEEAYADDIADHSTLTRMFNTNRGYDGLTMPHTVVKRESGRDGYLPQLDHRYLNEDLPCGLLVQKGIAVLAGVSTPVMDKVIEWCQQKMNKEFLVGGKLVGKDIAITRTPQRYGFSDLDAFIRANGYI
jgi:NAD/NADP octopine/nopaline dehydrogenase, alpha-helical domain